MNGALRGLWVICFAALLCAHIASATNATAGSSAASGSGLLLPVLTWNIQVNDFSEAHARAAMAAAVAVSPRPQVITIQEAWIEHYAAYLDELQRQTGQTWYGAFKTHCQAGQWNGSTCSPAWDQGIGIFSIHPITSTDSMLFPFPDCWTSARAGLRAALNVNGSTVQVFTTHLQTGGCTNDAQARYSSLTMLKTWASHYSTPQLLSGDFNAGPDQIDSASGLAGSFVDAWQVVGSGSLYTAFLPSPSMQLDYWLADVSGAAQPVVAAVVASAGTISDHRPVSATFQIMSAQPTAPPPAPGNFRVRS